MKLLTHTLSLLLLATATFAFAQHDAAPPAPKTDAQKSFATMKTLAGNWEGSVTIDPPQPDMSDGKPLHISM